MTWDVVVAGAGPAGAIASLILARAGARVLMLDRARFPRPKLCGDTVNPGALDVLRRLGLESVSAGGLAIRGMVVTGEPAVTVTGLYPGATPGVSLERVRLDARLVEAAAGAGATLADGRLVRGARLDGSGGRVIGVDVACGRAQVEPIAARVVIAADGHHSRIARALGLSWSARHPRRWALGAYFDNVSRLSACGEMHVRAGRYVGVAPLGDGRANVCLVTADRTLLQQRNPLPAALIEDPLLHGRFLTARMIAGPVVLGPLAVEAAAAGMPGLLLAGDAAGFIDPMTGDGLRFAFQGAELAAREALRALEHGWNDAHARLALARQGAFGAKWRFNRALRSLVSRPVAVRMAAAGARLAPSLLTRTIHYAGDIR